MSDRIALACAAPDRVERLSRVETWVFDLDNTLYPPALRLFDQVSALITACVMRELALDRAAACALRERYWRSHGTTLAGLMAHHGVDPDPFLSEVHAIDLAAVVHDRGLRDAIDALPGRKVVYTNGSRAHGERVAAALGLRGCFDAVYGVEDAGYAVKPQCAAFEAVFAKAGLDPARAAMIEDDERNLRAPNALGMATIWRPEDRGAVPGPHIHHVAHDLAAFLAAVRGAR